MTGLTINLDEEIIKRARTRALEQGTSINAVLSEYLRIYAGEHGAQNALPELVRMAKESSATSGHARTWTRDEIHER